MNCDIIICCEYCNFNSDALQTLFDQSSLEELIIESSDFESDHMHLPPHKNTNLKRLTITGYFIKPLAAVLPNITSMTYLRIYYPVDDNDLLVLINLVQSHTTLEELELSYDIICDDGIAPDDPTLNSLPQLMRIADNSRLVLKIDKGYYGYLTDKDYTDDNVKRMMTTMTTKIIKY